MQRVVVAGVVVALCSSSRAAAQVAAAPEVVPAAAAADEPGSPAIAFGLALGVPTVAIIASYQVARANDIAGSAVLTGALVVGPATGWLYAGRPRHALATSAIRLVASGIAIGGAYGGSGEGTVTIAAVAVLGTIAYDIVGAPVALSGDRTRWRERRQSAAPQAMLVPTAHEHGGGFALVGQF